MNSQSIFLNLSTDPETRGFDLQAGQSWIYPTNYPVRDYQFNIVQEALLKNTLVSLPTGLGKTFIAAVVMYNFYRWYPQGKVIFMAPTRPLVKQQVDACYDIMAIPKEATAELTGAKVVHTRENIWKEKRVFFITPQILENDLETFQDLLPKIKCLVFDEAHRARGNHSYCEIIRKLSSSNRYFRVLALSATPGGTINDVLEVVQNLLISHLEVRTEDSLDVSSYVFHRNLTTVVVPLGEKLQNVKDEYMKVLEYYTRNLIKFKVIQGNCGSLTKGKIFMTMRNFQQNAKGTSQNYGEIMKGLNICITLYHAYELLVRHGLRSFLTFYEEHIEKPLLRGNTSIIAIMNDIREYLGPAPNLEQLPDGEYPEASEDVKFGHPKFYKLQDILIEHFKQKGDQSRVIVFFEFRDSVMEAYALLIQSKPLLKPRIFLGQGQGITQKLQINVVKAFREGLCNILLSTSIGEEGLDVGEVDLIVCFDISNKSPIRMVQRMGRTGRKKEGSIIVLVTEGKEQQTLKDCLIHKNNVAVHVMGSRELAKGLKGGSPRLVPEGLNPKCEKIFITVKKPMLKKTSSLKDMFRSISSSSSEPSFSPDLKIVEIKERIPSSSLLVMEDRAMDENLQLSKIFSKRIEKQRSFQETLQVNHSKDTEIFVKLLQIADSRRFNIPMSQLGGTQESLNKNLKQADIRNMFVKSHSQNDFVVLSTQTPKTTQPFRLEDTSSFGSRELFNELSNFLTIEMTDLNKECKLCLGNMDCTQATLIRKPSSTLNWIELDESVFSAITEEDLKLFANSMDKVNTEFHLEDDTLDFGNIKTPKESEELIGLEDLIDNSILDGVFDKSCNFEVPKTLNNLLNKYSTSIMHVDSSQVESETKPTLAKEKKQIENDYRNKEVILSFFMLTSIEDIFESEDNVSSERTIIYSPDIFEPSPTLSNTRIISSPRKSCATPSSSEVSPILGTFEVVRKKQIYSQNVTRNLMKSSLLIESPSNFTMNRTKMSSTPLSVSQKNKITCEGQKSSDRSPSNDDKKVGALDPTDEKSISSDNTKVSSSKSEGKICEIEDICDISFFGIPGSVENVGSPEKKLTKNSNLISSDKLSEITELSDICNAEDFVDNSFFENQQHTLKAPQVVDRPTSPSQVTITQMISLVNSDNGNGAREKTCNDQVRSSSTDVGLNSLDTKENHSQVKCTPRQNPFLSKNNNPQLSKPIISNIPHENPFLRKTESTLQEKENNSAGHSTSSQKENQVDFIDSVDNDLFDFSFNNKKPTPKKPRKLSPLQRNSHNVFDQSEVYSGVVKSVGESMKCLNMSLQSNTSDDEFEIQPFTRPNVNCVKRKTKCSENESTVRNSKNNKLKTRKRVERQFIDDEAELSFCDVINISDDEEDEENEDCYDASFVADESQYVDTQMQVKYLQSVRSPVLARKENTQRKPIRNIDVYSQEVEREDDTYLDDTFVVHEELEELISSQAELTELEILEKKLEMQHKKRKKPGSGNPVKKRRRIIEESDSD